jgi:small subunit ribosomal protein S15
LQGVKKDVYLQSENKKFKKIITMYLTTEIKKDIFKKHGKSATDTGSSEGQIALFSHRIAHLTEHLKSNKKDFVTQKSLIALVSRRRGLLDYLKTNNLERYRAIVKTLDLRK